MLKVSKRTLLLVAGIVWCLAGGNIAWLGIQEFVQVDSNMCWLLAFGAVVVFVVFHIMIFQRWLLSTLIALNHMKRSAFQFGNSLMLLAIL